MCGPCYRSEAPGVRTDMRHLFCRARATLEKLRRQHLRFAEAREAKAAREAKR